MPLNRTNIEKKRKLIKRVVELKQRGLSHAEISKKTGISKNMVSYYWRQRNNDLDPDQEVVGSKAGRKPADYATLWNDKVKAKCMEALAKGAAIRELLPIIGISPAQFTEWYGNPERKDFTEAIVAGKRMSDAWWLEQGRRAVWRHKDNPEKFNFLVWSMVMRNRFGWDDKTPQVELEDGTTKRIVDNTLRERVPVDAILAKYRRVDDTTTDAEYTMVAPSANEAEKTLEPDQDVCNDKPRGRKRVKPPKL